MLWLNTGNSSMKLGGSLDTQQTWGGLIVEAISINNHIDTSLSNVTRSDWVIFCAWPLPKISNPIFPFGLSLHEKLSAIKCEMLFFYSPERVHKGSSVHSSPSGFHCVSEFARDHYSVASCYPIHFAVSIFHFTSDKSRMQICFTHKNSSMLAFVHKSSQWENAFFSFISRCSFPSFQISGTVGLQWTQSDIWLLSMARGETTGNSSCYEQ